MTKTKKKKALKLYVWEDVLVDYTAGMMFALAANEEQARALILEQYGRSNSTVANDVLFKPVAYTKPAAFICWGSS